MNECILTYFSEYHWYIGFIHFVMAVALFFIANWIGAHSISVGYMQMNVVIKEDSAPAFNFLFKVIAPLVYLILTATLFQQIGLPILINNCYLIVVYYWIFRVFWIVCTGRASLTNWTEQIIHWVCSIGLSVWIYSLLESVDKILPNPRSLLDQLWILIIIFIYSVLNQVQLSRAKTIMRKEAYLANRYIKFQSKYDNIIKEFFHNDDIYKAITYSIMIYEDFNRPIIVRWIEYINFFIKRNPHTLGIMQVMTTTYINNEESIRLAMQKIKEDGNNIKKELKKEGFYSADLLVYKIADKYNGGDSYASEISQVYSFIAAKFYNITTNDTARI